MLEKSRRISLCWIFELAVFLGRLPKVLPSRQVERRIVDRQRGGEGYRASERVQEIDRETDRRIEN